MSIFRTATALLLAAILSAPSLGATLDLKDGTSLIGDVVEVADDHLVFKVLYPETRIAKLSRLDIAPRSLFEIEASRTDLSDPSAQLKLAELGESLGLYGHAIATLRRAAELDTSLSGVVESKIAEVEQAIAASIVDRSRSALEEGDWATAKLNLAVVTAQYGHTPAASDAAKLMSKVEESMRAAEPRPRTARESRNIAKSIREVESRLKKATALEAKLGSVGNSSKERRERERVIKILEGAWDELMEIPELTPAEQESEHVAALNEQVRGNLHDAYVNLGTLFVGRLALPSAEEVNAKACRFDPASGGCAKLQSLIVQARITSAYTRRR